MNSFYFIFYFFNFDERVLFERKPRACLCALYFEYGYGCRRRKLNSHNKNNILREREREKEKEDNFGQLSQINKQRIN